MSTISVTNLLGETREIELKPGWSLMEVLRDAGYDEILAMCGGSCSCATCHVHIENHADRQLPPIEEDEEMLLTMSDSYHESKSRLSCQIELSETLAGLKVSLLAEE